MSLLTSIIAKALALADYALEYFVTVTDTGMTVGNATCGVEFTVWNAQMTPCGESFIDNLLALGYSLVLLAPDLMEGLFAIK